MQRAEQTMPSGETTTNGRTRLKVLQVVLLLLFGVVCVRLVQIQIVQSAYYKNIAEGQYRSMVILPATRGALLDRNGEKIASNTMFVSFAADPKRAADDARQIASRFSTLFGKPRNYYLEKLSSDQRFVWLERQVNLGFLRKVDLKKLEGVVVRYEPTRLYHHDHVAGQLVGSTKTENDSLAGLAGVELEFDRQLRGKNGYVVFQRDGHGLARPSVDYPKVDPVDGNNVMLTIDIRIQAIAEKELKRGVEESGADRGLVVILQPRTGEVLAVAQYPPVDPNHFGASKQEDQKLRAITDLYEPGSVFKIVTASAALENNLVTPEKKYFAENGVYTLPVAGGKFRTIRDTHKEGWITFQQAIEVSSNIVMAKVSDIIGPERLYKTARDFGFGIATDIDFPGESKGVLKKPVEWSGTSLNSIAYGYEVGVTPLQIASAYAAVANGGVLMQPRIFSREIDPEGNVVREDQPRIIRRVISESTARTLTQLLEGVVERGTGKSAKIPGIRIAGKTGTSKKLENGQYGSDKHTASFVGFFPVESPQAVCLVMMENTRGDNYTGGMVSAPVFHAIAQHIINTSAIIPEVRAERMVAAPVNDSQENGGKNIEGGGLSTRMAVNVSPDVVPNVIGYTVRRALFTLTSAKLEPCLSGSGIVVGQSPPAGQPARPGMKIALICQDRTMATPVNN